MLCHLFLVTSVLQTEAFKPPQQIRLATAASNTPYVLTLKNLNHLLPGDGVFRLAVNEAMLLIMGVFEHFWCHRSRNVTKKTATVLNVERAWDILRVWLRHTYDYTTAGSLIPARNYRFSLRASCCLSAALALNIRPLVRLLQCRNACCFPMP